MKTACPKCGAELEYSSTPPLFCSQCGTALNPAQMAETRPPESTDAVVREKPGPGTIIGNYRLLRQLGAGGMGQVFEAEDVTSGRRVAVKVLLGYSTASADMVERFRREGRLASALTHPRCVFVLAADEEAGQPYIVMELMSGETLEDFIQEQGPLPPEQAIPMILDVIDGLQQAHKLGIIHRDVKPSNCFVEADGRVKVGDFGLSKSLTHSQRLTKTGSFLGTPLFASPEQIKGEKVDARTDVYSVAATLYHLLTGKPPLMGSDATATLARIVADPPDPLSGHIPNVDPQLEKVVLRALEKNPARRWRNMKEFKKALERCQQNRLSTAGLGLRFIAHVVDQILMSLVIVPFVFAFASTWRVTATSFQVGAQATRPTGLEFVSIVLAVVYFAVSEGIWGTTWGKLFLQLRVYRVDGSSPPGLWRGLVRALSFEGLISFNTVIWVTAWFFWLPPDATYQSLPQTDPRMYFLLLGITFGTWALALGLIVLPMRTRNGYRGLHEWLSGTRTVLLPAVRESRLYPAQDLPLFQPARCPTVLGPYRVQGALYWTDADKVLVGRDETLDRQVWLWLRAETEAPLSEARRELSRSGRLRWLSRGEANCWQWDAFSSVPGSSLRDLVRKQGHLFWPDARPVLEQLADELTASAQQDLLPSTLTIDQVWVEPDGTIHLIDLPLNGDDSETVADITEGSQQTRPLMLLRQASVCVLGGDNQQLQVKAPLPGHARAIFERLCSQENPYAHTSECQADFQATQDQPVEVRRQRRFVHLIVQACFLFSGLGCCMFPFGTSLGLMQTMAFSTAILEKQKDMKLFQKASTLELAAGMCHPHPLPRLQAALQFEADRQQLRRLRRQIDGYRQRRAGAVAAQGWFTQQYIKQVEGAFRKQYKETQKKLSRPMSGRDLRAWRKRLRREIVSARRRMTTMQEVFSYSLLVLLFWPILWVVWAFLARGGLSLRLSGIALVRRDGRPAARWQCALRALLVWLPLTALLMLSAWLSLHYWSTWQPNDPRWWIPQLSVLAWYSAVLVGLAFVTLAIWRPARAPHDRMCGTYLVPR